MAVRGASYAEILETFYPGTRLVGSTAHGVDTVDALEVGR
jgi:hypothetical protein